MLHQFNYVTPLSHFLSLHQSLQQSQTHNENSSNSVSSPSLCEEMSSANNHLARYHNKELTGVNCSSKSFTIAAILGLRQQHEAQTDEETNDESPTDLTTVMNLSVHHQGGGGDVGPHLGGLPRTDRLGQMYKSASGPHHQQYGAASVGGVVCARPTDRVKLSSSCKKSAKSKRVRTIFTPEQLERLEAEFERQQYMVGPERLYLAHTLQLTEAQVKVWFQNRRIKWRKHHLELTQQRLAAIKQQQQLHQQLLQETDAVQADGSSSGVEEDT